MKTVIIQLLVIFIIIDNMNGQEYSKEFGVIGQNEINLTRYAKDPEAEAVILFDIGDSKFIDSERGYDIQFTRAKRVKILTRAGVKFAEVSIPFYNDGYGKTEIIESIEAFSYNFENGSIIKKELDQKLIYQEKINNLWNVKKFVFPDVKAGTIVEYRYVLVTPFHFNLPDWEFQGRIPNIFSKYTVRMIPFYEYVYIAQGITRFDSQSSVPDSRKRTYGSVSIVYGKNEGSGFEFQDLVHTYVMKDVPAFKDESYISTVDDYLMKVDFQLSKFYSPYGGTTEVISTWPNLIKDMLKTEEFGKYLKTSEKLTDKILGTELKLENKTDMEKCRLIIDYVKSGFSWDKNASIYATRSPKEFLSQKKGNSAEINLFLTSLLTSAGIKASPVLISTRDHGKIKSDYPYLHFFNYVIVLVEIGDRGFMADATEFFLPFNRIPPRCINEKGLVINSEDERWVNLNNEFNSIDEKTITINITPETLKAKADLKIQASEYDSFWYKISFLNDTVKIRKHFNESGFPVVNKITAQNYENSRLPYVLSCEGEIELEQLDNKIIVSPFLSFYPKESELTQSNRSYPVDMTYTNTEKCRSTIKIPIGYKVLSMPEEYKIDNELVEIILESKATEVGVDIIGSYRFKKAVYQAAEYSRIKMYMDAIAKKFNSQVVLEKI